MLKSAVLTCMAIMLFAVVAQASMSYECWSYKNGHPDKMVHVLADNNQQAQARAQAKFKKMGISFDYVKCK